MSDAQINSFHPGAYRTVVTGTYSSTRFFNGSCSYSSTAYASTSACLTSYSDPGLTTNARVGTAYTRACGLSDYQSSNNSLNIASNECSGTGRSYSWFGGGGLSGGKYGADYGTGGLGTNQPVDIQIWVR